MRGRSTAAESLPNRLRSLASLGSVLLVLLVGAVFGQTASFDFVNIDDNSYVTENPIVQQGLSLSTILWAFTTTDHAGFWQPFVWLSLMLDVDLFGKWAGGFHLTNVVLHSASTLLLFHWLSDITGCVRRSFFVAAVFAVHPLHVESVVWITERKDVLCILFGLIALRMWARYVRTPDRWFYVAAWLAMAASLMAKQMLVTLPFVMLLLDYWPLRRMRSSPAEASVEKRVARSFFWLVKEKIPFLLLTVAMSAAAWGAQKKFGATTLMPDLTLVDRLFNGSVAYVLYLWKSVWPTTLAVFYPHPENTISTTAVFLSGLLLTAITVFTYIRRHSQPSLLIGWLWFLGTLVPVIGLVQVGYQQMADRFIYFPLIGLAIGIAFLYPRRRSVSIVVFSAGIAYLLCIAVVSFRQVQHWRNSVTLSYHGVTVTDNNWLLHATLGAAIAARPDQAEHLLSDGQNYLQLAEEHLRMALKIRHNYAPAHFNLGLVLSDQGKLAQANECFQRAIRHSPGYIKAQYYLCINLRRLGDAKELSQQLNVLAEMEAGLSGSDGHRETHSRPDQADH